ncbi:MAG TPA: hypothetical protein VKA00_06800 [Trueperaceae bacterium]|nr:hypothetical protein [Trueperaceae bacterium]
MGTGRSPAGSRRPRPEPRLRGVLPGSALALALVTALAACCPVTGPPATAFTARLSPLGGGRAVARLADGRRVTLTGLNSVPSGPVYVTGHLLDDGDVAVTGLRPLAAAPGATP